MKPPATYDELRAGIAAAHDGLSPRLQQIAAFALAHPNDIALETVAVVAERADVQPSSLIRFAKALGFEGFTEMQRVFRGRLVDQAPSYNQRIKALTAGGKPGIGAPHQVLDHFVESGVHALQHLRDEVRPGSLERAVEMLHDAALIHIVGQRRSFPVASYLAYALGHLGRRAVLIDGVGGTVEQQARAIAPGDAVLAISFAPYAPETAGVVRDAVQRGVPVVAITDAPLSPLVPLASVCFEVEDAAVTGFRSLTATMCLAVSLVVALGQHAETRGHRVRAAHGKPARRRRGKG